MFIRRFDPLISLFYPQDCRICGGEVANLDDGVVCAKCWDTAKFVTGFETLCTKCGAYLGDAEPLFETYCKACDEHDYDSAAAAALYRGPVAAALLQLKQVPSIPPRLSGALCAVFDDRFRSLTTLIVPVPLSARRLFERGFNQASIIADRIARHSGLPLDEHSLVRRIHTAKHRAVMDSKARHRTVKSAFHVKRPKLIAGQNVLLIDDILTSGATASFCAKALKQSGAETVNVLTVARAAYPASYGRS